MASLTLTRSGVFDPQKLSLLEQQLAAVPGPVQVYASATGLVCIFPTGLTAGQQTTAQGVINAYTQPTDASFLTPLQQQALTFLANNSPTAAQQLTALKQVIKVLLALSYKQPFPTTKIDGTDLTQ